MSIEFSRIKRLPQYVFNITGELKMAARRRGEDIIDLSMGYPDGPIMATLCRKEFLVYVKRSRIGIRIATA
jgi:hypothetical protein